MTWIKKYELFNISLAKENGQRLAMTLIGVRSKSCFIEWKSKKDWLILHVFTVVSLLS